MIQVASDCIFQILQACNSELMESSELEASAFSDLIFLFANELSSFNPIVRSISQKSLQQLSASSKRSVI